MTTKLQALQTLIEEYRRAGQTLTGSLIADCFTSRDPITRERLEELGFEPSPEKPSSDWRWIIVGNVKLTWSGLPYEGGKSHVMQHFPIESDGFIDSRRGSYVIPAPQTMGDLYRLLEQLTRE